MTISAGLSSALSGLTAANKAVEVISNNIANATTRGYARRELITQSRAVGSSGQGVQIVAIRREVNLPLQNERRLAQAEAAGRTAIADFYLAGEQAIGTPDSTLSLQTRISDLDAALIEAASRPDSAARLQSVLDAATALADHIGASAEQVQTARGQADGAIARMVEETNLALQRIADLNGTIRATNGGGGDASALMDQRQALIDDIATVVPLRLVEREGGAIALFTRTGATLLDGLPARLGFTRSNAVTPDQTIGTGGLSGLTLNGRNLATSGQSSPIAGGALAAQFAIRDDLGVQAQGRLDALARDLAERFSGGVADTSLPPGSSGLFTDAGQPVSAAQETGLAQRLAVHAAADPDQGGALWRLRDGLGAAVAGEAGRTDLLLSMQGALSALRGPVSGGFMTGATSFAGLASTLISDLAADRLRAGSEESHATARAAALAEDEAAGGVDTDQELQALLVMERAYAANAKVIQAIGTMMDRLLEM